MRTPIEPGQWVRWRPDYKPIDPPWDGWAMVEGIFSNTPDSDRWLAILSVYNEETGDLAEHKVLTRALTTEKE